MQSKRENPDPGIASSTDLSTASVDKESGRRNRHGSALEVLPRCRYTPAPFEQPEPLTLNRRAADSI